MNKILRNTLVSAALIAATAPVVAGAALLPFRLNYIDANNAGGLGATLNNNISAVVDEYKYTAESLIIFRNGTNPGNLPGIDGGDVFVDYGVLRGDGLNYQSNSAGDFDYITQNVQISAVFMARGFQLDPLNYIVTDARIRMYFDAPANGAPPAGGIGGTGNGTYADFTNLGTFVDGLLVQTGIGGGAGTNSPLIPDGALGLTFTLTDMLSTYSSDNGEFGPFELFKPFFDLSRIAFLTDSNNNQCSGTVACGSTVASLESFFDINTLDGDFFFQTRSDGSAVKVPEPATLALMGLALLGFGFSRRGRKAS